MDFWPRPARMVNDGLRKRCFYGFKRVDGRISSANPINRKFTPNQLIRIFRPFLAGLPQCKHFRFIDGC